MKSLRLMFVSAAIASTLATVAQAQVDPGGVKVPDRQVRTRTRRPPPAEPEYRELRCRGSSAMRIQVGEGRSTSIGEQMMNMVVTIDPVHKPTDQSGSNLQPGQCAFADWTMPGAMPSLIQQEIVAFGQLKQQLHGSAIDTSPTAAERFPDGQNVPQYLKVSSHYWSFFVKNNGQGYFVASSGRFWKPSYISPVEPKDRITILQRGNVYDQRDSDRNRLLTDFIGSEIQGTIRWKKEYGLPSIDGGRTPDKATNCTAIRVQATVQEGTPGRFGSAVNVGYIALQNEPTENGGYYTCSYSITDRNNDLPRNRVIAISALLGPYASAELNRALTSGRWYGLGQPQPPPGYQRVATGGRGVTLTDAAPRATVDFEVVYRPPTATPR